MRRVQLVRKLLEDPKARVGHVEEALECERRQPVEIWTLGERAADCRAVASERDVLDLVPPGAENARRLGGRCLDQVALLLLAAATEPVRGRTALLVAALDETGADLRGDELLALEDAERVAPEANEERGNPVIGPERGEQRLDHHLLVLALVVEPERRRDGERLLRQLETGAAIAVDGTAGGALERSEPLLEVGPADVTHVLGAEPRLAADAESLLECSVFLAVLARRPDETNADDHHGDDRNGDDQDPDCRLPAHEVAVIVMPAARLLLQRHPDLVRRETERLGRVVTDLDRERLAEDAFVSILAQIELERLRLEAQRSGQYSIVAT